MIEYLRLLVLIVVVGVVGAQALRLLAGSRDRGWLEFIALAYLVGLAGTAAACFIMSLAGFAVKPAAVAAALGAFLVASEIVIRMRRVPAEAKPSPAEERHGLNVVEGLLLVIVGFASLYVLAQAFVFPLEQWDAWAMWSLKAKVLAAEPIRTTTYFHDTALSYSHPEYPLLVPFTQAATWAALGQEDQLLVLVPLTLMFLAFQAGAYCKLRELTGGTTALAVIAGISWIPFLQRTAGAGLADVPLMVFHGLGVLYLVSWVAGRDRRGLLIAALLGAAGAFTKTEGLALVGVNAAGLALIALVGHDRKRIFAGLGVYVAVAAACLLPWLVFRMTLGPGTDFAGAAGMSLGEKLGRIPAVLLGIMNEMIYWQRWGIFWPVVILGAILAWGAILRRENMLVAAVLVLQLGLYAGAFVFTQRDLSWHMATAMNRLLLQAAPVAGALLALELHGFLGKGQSETT